MTSLVIYATEWLVVSNLLPVTRVYFSNGSAGCEMAFEGQGGDSWMGRSPGGFEFGIQGWTYGQPVPRSITFFLDGSAMVCDQYGRYIRRAITASGAEVAFADSPPEASREGRVVPRPQFASHAQVLAALAEERIDWQAYEVHYRARNGSVITRGGLTLKGASELQLKLVKEGHTQVVMDRTIVSAGWPQLPYEQLKGLHELPPTPLEELRKIPDPALRKDALRVRREADEAREREFASTEAE